jgi:formylglycine-generating enzyme required for sulfatase activity
MAMFRPRSLAPGALILLTLVATLAGDCCHAADKRRPGEERADNGLQMRFCWIPAGIFTMGSPVTEAGRDNDEEQVAATLSEGFWLGKFEVTQSDWVVVMNTTPWKGKEHVRQGGRYPATHVSWNDATEFCRRLTKRERASGRLNADERYRLPTEAEWEYACRAGTATAYSFGDDQANLSTFAWWGGVHGEGNARSEKYAHQVGRKRPNGWGLHDMHGNVYEWCEDDYVNKPPGGSVLGKVFRGGCWHDGPRFCRSAYRSVAPRGYRLNSLGFRVLRGFVK